MRPQWLPSIILICLMGCASWIQVGGKLDESSLQFQADLPQGWMRSNNAENALLITRDGLLLQSINVQRLAIDEPLEYTRKRFSKDLLPQELAEIELDNVRSDPNVTHFELLENTPADVDGRPGFKLVYTYRTREGLKIKGAHYGILLAEWVYRIQYRAPLQYYFERDFDAFERMLGSVRLRAQIERSATKQLFG